jgi:hypothetical protein
MKVTSLITLLACTTAFAGDTVQWNFSEETGGEDIQWISPTSVDPNANQFEYNWEITYIGVDVVFLGIVIGPVNVTDQIDPESRMGSGVLDGPAPIVLMNETLDYDVEEDGDIDIRADFFMQVNGKGYGEFSATNLFFGDIYVDTGFPFGWQTVDIDRIYMDGEMTITPIIVDCPEDTNNDGLVNVTDLLNAVGNWGSNGLGDVDSSGIVDVSDILAIVNAWGSCS